MSQDLLNIYWLLESCQHSKVLVCVTMFESQESYIVQLRQQIFKAVDDEVSNICCLLNGGCSLCISH